MRLSRSSGTRKKRRQLCIGIVADPSMRKTVHGSSYIRKEYVDWFEKNGVRVVPIPFDTTEPERYFHMVNGLCIQGSIKGENAIHKQFVKTVTQLYELSLQAKEYFPIWAECFGFQLLMSIVGRIRAFDEYDATGLYPIYPTNKTKYSQLIMSFSKAYQHYLEHSHSTYHNHFLGISPEQFMKKKELHAFFHIVSTSFDKDGKEFVSIIEAKKYPIYGLAFHPLVMKRGGPFVDFIVAELRKNKHRCEVYIPYLHQTHKYHTYQHNEEQVFDYYIF